MCLEILGYGGLSILVALVTYRLWRRPKVQDLKDKVVLLTGASSGIGEALAEELVCRRCKVIMAARAPSRQKLEDFRCNLISTYKVDDNNIKVVSLDLADHAAISEVAEQCLQFYGRVDILVNNAGISCRDEVVGTTMDTYKTLMNVDFFGQVALTKELLPSMIERGGGSIVAISSVQGRVAIPFSSAYSAAKHALQAFCDSLRVETAKQNIHVLVISPGYVSTNIFDRQLRGNGSLWNPDERRAVYAKGMSSKYVAMETIKSIIHREDERVIAPLKHRLLVYVRVLLPNLCKTLLGTLRKESS